MSLFDIFLMGIGLAMDAFAVSICKGLCMKKFNSTQASVIALFFGDSRHLCRFWVFIWADFLKAI